MSILDAIINFFRRLFGSPPPPPPPPAPPPSPPPPPPRAPSGPDNYPGDAAFTDLLQKIYHGANGQGGISNDKIKLKAHTNPNRADGTWTRTEIVTLLLDRYDDIIAGSPRPDSCKSWLFNTNFTVAACVASLTNPSAYDDASGWRNWAGSHSGTWYSDGQGGAAGPTFKDDAKWNPPRDEGRHPPGSVPPAGSPYDFQPVDFKDAAGNVVRRGWNQSHKDVEYLWSWDPKDEGQQNGEIGAHLGFRHVEDGAEAIFWFTCREVFFEAIKEVDGVKHRISVGIWGRGLWTVT